MRKPERARERLLLRAGNGMGGLIRQWLCARVGDEAGTKRSSACEKGNSTEGAEEEGRAGAWTCGAERGHACHLPTCA